MDLLNLVAKLTLDKTQYESALKEATNTASVDKMSKNIGKVALGMTAAIGAFGISSVKSAAEFDTSMSQVAATMGKTTDQIKDLEDFAMQMGATTKFTASEAADGINILAMAGLEANEIMAALPVTLDLASAGAIDMATAAEYVTGAVVGFGDSMENAEHYSNLMSKGATLAKTDVSGLGAAFNKSAAISHQYAQTAEGTTLALLRMAQGNMTAEVAGTALNATMKNLYAPTDQAKEAMDALGVSAYDEFGQFRDLNEVVDELNVALSDLSPAQRAATLNTIFGQQGFKGYSAMVSSSEEAVNGFKDGLAAADESAVLYKGKIYDITEAQEKWGDAIYSDESFKVLGSSAAQAMTQLDNLEGDITLLGSAFDGLRISIGKKLMPIARSLVKWLTNMIGDFEKYVPVIAALTTGFIAFAVAINFTKTVEAVTKAMATFNAILAANPIGITIAAIAALVAGFVALYKTNEDFRNLVNNVWKKIQETIQGVIDAITGKFKGFSDTFNLVIATIKMQWTLMKESLLTVWEEIQSYLQVGIDFLKGIFDTGIKFISDLWNTYGEEIIGTVIGWFEQLVGLISPAMELIRTVIEVAWSNIKFTFESAMNIIKPIVSNALDFIKKLWDTWGSTITKLVSIVWSQIKNFISTALNVIKGIIKTVTSLIRGDWSGVWDGIKSIVSSVWNGIKTMISNNIDFVKTIISGGLGRIKETFSNIWNGVKKTVSDVWDGIKNTISSAIDRIKGFMNFDWSLPKIKLPHFSVSGSANPIDWLSKGVPSINVDWYRKAYDKAIMFTRPTVIPTAEGFKGFGDGSGAEVVIGANKLQQLLGGARGDIVQNITINAPQQLDASEVARRTKNANREMILALNGVR